MELKKFRLLFDKDVEQNWLNQMCQNGWALKSFKLGVYTFESCEHGKYIYQIDLLPGSGFTPTDPEGYADFMEDIGVEVVCRWFRWIILRKRTEDGPFDIYTDPDSQIQMYSRIRTMFTFALGIELCCSTSIWLNLHRGGIFLTLLVLLYVAIVAAFIRVIITCNRKIKSLEALK